MTTPPAVVPTIIGRRTMRVLKILLLASLAVLVYAMVIQNDLFIVILVAMAAIAWILVAAPSALFLAHSVRHRREGVDVALRRPTTENAVPLILLGLLALPMQDSPELFVIGIASIVLATAAIVRAWTAARRPANAAPPYTIPHGKAVVGGFVLAFLIMVIVPKFRGVPRQSAYVAISKSDLHNLLSAEEVFFSDSGRYTTSLPALGFRQSTGASPPEIVVGKDSWSATNTHERAPGIVCGIAMNTTNPVGGASTESGDVVCK